ncbi:tRNA 2-selenouridine(34) synthase MnmH [Lysinibacillus sp. 2017]|uniref:tRNA 2-selenouridine(34) synthase MnmH n=1 Tax=unclassified Lysinibacillus TaxID=2636778 RepID=UPI000D52694A|nr:MULTISPECIES: tRNA 2-selenouridine(34) synthase MnmH [unclassified Lysinibacillus]AWE08563.1 tRNA 2-selenouridine(34) synthase MnmH [Lysinibacillus sp. 2017]TGN35653.1 tRNA 2-selenouridine(34) synthase MnmH [Lysinibacillus sp. S2017]
MFQDISIEELLSLKDKNKLTLIDVRSPSEYKDATIPGSMNIPFFNDEERAEVGTIYKQVSVDAAKERGLEIASAKLPRFVKQFAELEGKKAVFCWRGGMRSRTTATVLSLMGIKVFRLEGGYRTYRNWVVNQLESLELKPKAYVLNGYTGTGKTIILHHLNDEGYPTLDLEGMANHRGSVFGQIGLEPSNQKRFDALLYENIKRVQKSPFVFLEGESKRIGRVVIPDFVLEKKNHGLQLFIELPVEERVKHILEDYQPWDHEEECLEAFIRVKRRIHTPIANKIEMDLKSGDYSSAVRLLLEYYYDPLYNHSAEQFPEDQKITIKVNTTDEAIDYIRKLISTKKHSDLQ